MVQCGAWPNQMHDPVWWVVTFLHLSIGVWVPISISDQFDAWHNVMYVTFYSPIHKAASSSVTGRSLQNGKMSMGNCHTERPPDPILYGSRLSGGFVNSAVTMWYHFWYYIFLQKLKISKVIFHSFGAPYILLLIWMLLLVKSDHMIVAKGMHLIFPVI